jgi:hypothetical protein
MSSKRLHLILLATVGLLFIGLIGGTYGINKLLGTKATQLTALKAKSLALASEQISLNEAKKDIAKYADLEKIAQAVVPEDKDQADAVREIVNIAAANDVSLAAITFPASTLGTSNTGEPGVPVSAAAPPPASAANQANALSQLTAVKNIPGVYQLLITINGDPNQSVPYSQFINFLSDLEHDRRTAQVNTITLQPDSNNPNNLTFALTLNEYIKP